MSFPTRDSRLWMPYTQMKTAPAPPLVRSGKGAVLELEDGRQINYGQGSAVLIVPSG